MAEIRHELNSLKFILITLKQVNEADLRRYPETYEDVRDRLREEKALLEALIPYLSDSENLKVLNTDTFKVKITVTN